MAVIGFGIGTFIVPNTNALMGSAPRNRQGIASGILATARNVGMVLGVGISGAVFTSVRSLTISSGVNQSIFTASHASFLVAAGAAGAGVFISALRGTIGPAVNSEPAPELNSRDK
jgi:MFS family permease